MGYSLKSDGRGVRVHRVDRRMKMKKAPRNARGNVRMGVTAHTTKYISKALRANFGGRLGHQGM